MVNELWNQRDDEMRDPRETGGGVSDAVWTREHNSLQSENIHKHEQRRNISNRLLRHKASHHWWSVYSTSAWLSETKPGFLISTWQWFSLIHSLFMLFKCRRKDRTRTPVCTMNLTTLWWTGDLFRVVYSCFSAADHWNRLHSLATMNTI